MLFVLCPENQTQTLDLQLFLLLLVIDHVRLDLLG